jgi:5,6-dimethylbenzimidazole synthase
VTCDRNKDSNNVLGQSTEPQMDIYSTVCAIQNMWLAARVENIGMGWVSILENDFLRATLDIPKNIEIIGYFCLGYVDEFFDKPELESKGWNHRHPPDIHYEKW